LEYNLLYGVKVSPYAGGVRNKSLIDVVKPHVNKDVVVKMDFSNFFDTINVDLVYGAFLFILIRFKKDKNNEEIAHDLRTLSLLTTYYGKLPQGAPTSNALANIILYQFDKAFVLLLNTLNVSFNKDFIASFLQFL
jgi:RNA-directed DNA polymerase